MKKILFTIFCLLILSSELCAKEKLLYAIRYESLQRYPDIVYTEIYSIDIQNKKGRIIFSDENTSIMLLPKRGLPGHPGDVIVSSINKIFAHAVEKKLNPGRWYSYKASVYELSTDGSNKFIKLFDVIGDQSLAEIFVNPSGSKIGYINYLDQNIFIFIHETTTGKLLYKINVTNIFLDCFASNIGWLPDNGRLFFTLVTGDEHVTSEESYSRIGTYLMKEDGTDLIKLSKNLFSLIPTTDGLPPFIRILPDNTYLVGVTNLKEVYHKAKINYETLLSLYKINKFNNNIPQKIFSKVFTEGINWFKISYTGKYISFTEKIYEMSGEFAWVEDVWVIDLEFGKENKIFSFSAKPFKGYYLGLVGWLENGNTNR